MAQLFTSIDDARPNPQKRNILILKLSRAPWWLLALIIFVVVFVLSVSESTTYQNAWAAVRKGIWTTIWVTVVAYSIALVLGLMLALLRRPSRSVTYNLFVYQPATIIVEFIRGIPTLVFVLYFALALVPQMVGLLNGLGTSMIERDIDALRGIGEWLAALVPRDVPTVWRAIAALAISYAAFLSEVFRAGLDSVDQGQREAARSLGMSQWQVMRFVVLPQAIRNILPALGNDFIAMLKESSLVSVVGVQDITRAGQSFAAATFTFFQSYNVVAVTYLVLTLTLSMFVGLIERYLGRGRRD
ncbi:MAG: amino acid ABC transporter permease [Anaerolineaceae bacterium]|nr:MAG: amino acid ABC transporter permease [Anaerolineaceae bacterium]